MAAEDFNIIITEEVVQIVTIETQGLPGTPVLHNDLLGLQGGGAGERYHLTAAELAQIATNAAKVSFPEAPNDGKQYGRQSEAWSEVAAGGGAYNLVAKHVSDGTETQITFAGLSGSKYYRIVFDLSVAMVGSAVISFTVNGDASSSGYNRSRLIGTGANNATNDSEFIRGQSTWTGWHGSLDISVNDGLSAHGTWGRFGGGQGTLNQYVIEKPGAGFNGITQIDIFSSLALTAGMTFRIFEVQESP